jgi:hypothetical protein
VQFFIVSRKWRNNSINLACLSKGLSRKRPELLAHSPPFYSDLADKRSTKISTVITSLQIAENQAFLFSFLFNYSNDFHLLFMMGRRNDIPYSGCNRRMSKDPDRHPASVEKSSCSPSAQRSARQVINYSN